MKIKTHTLVMALGVGLMMPISLWAQDNMAVTAGASAAVTSRSGHSVMAPDAAHAGITSADRERAAKANSGFGITGNGVSIGDNGSAGLTANNEGKDAVVPGLGVEEAPSLELESKSDVLKPPPVMSPLRYTEEGFKALEERLSKGSPQQKYELAMMYLNGGAPHTDVEKAFTYMKAASDGGLNDAKAMLYMMYVKGLGTKVDLIEANKLESEIQQSGDIHAVFLLNVFKEQNKEGGPSFPLP